MALYRCGGGLNLDLTNPDVTSNATMNGSTSRTITVAKMPRFIVYGYSRTDATGYGGVLIYDVTKKVQWESMYTSNGFIARVTEYPDALPWIFNSISDTAVVVNTNSNYKIRNYVIIYY